jgi:hypothetical protein
MRASSTRKDGTDLGSSLGSAPRPERRAIAEGFVATAAG